MAATRIIKEREERKSEILNAAQELFNQKGYEATPVSAIIDEVGVSKGTFYHYFSSKEELLDCLAARVTTRVLKRARAAMQEGMDAVAKFNTFFIEAARWKAANREVILMLVEALYRDENVLLRHKITQRMVERCAPEIADIIRQGIDEDVFDVASPDDTAELVFDLGIGLREATAGLFLALDEDPDVWSAIERKLCAFQTAIERVLGAPKRSIRFMDEEAMAVFRGGPSAADGGGGREPSGAG